VRQGFHARKVMESYQSWFGEGPELSVLRMLGLFDRPADEKALRALLKPPAIHGLTESLGRVCKSSLLDNAPQLEVKRMMRLRPKVKELLPKIAEALISIEIDSLERQ
jgi:hypothetical protein